MSQPSTSIPKSEMFCLFVCLFVCLFFCLFCCFLFYFGTLLSVVCKRVHVLYTLFVFVCLKWCPTYIVLCFCFVFLRLGVPMLPVSLDGSFFFAPSVFSNVLFQQILNYVVTTRHIHGGKHVQMSRADRSLHSEHLMWLFDKPAHVSSVRKDWGNKSDTFTTKPPRPPGKFEDTKRVIGSRKSKNSR